MPPHVTGIHHVSALTADGQRNIDFYAGVLGLRLVKVTVNFDDPRSYHLYFGNEVGAPGTGMTFFVWQGVRAGRHGVSQVNATAFAVPPKSLEFWRERLQQRDVTIEGESTRFGERVLTALDPDGLRFELVETANDSRTPWHGSEVSVDHAIRGFHSVTLLEEGYEQTATLLTNTLGFRAAGEAGHRFRFVAGDSAGGVVDVLCTPGMRRGSYGAGMVHHVAFRIPDDVQQLVLRSTLANLAFNVSPVMDRMYFHSIYFREPGGVLFEVATEGAGFTIDEPMESLGTSLKLPPMHEPMRREIEASLPKLRLPGGAVVP